MPARRDGYAKALQQIHHFLVKAGGTALREPVAMALATADAGGRPSVRTVLLKALDERGAVFYTNLMSRKARELAANPRAALCLYWDPLRIQVLIEGRAEPVSDAEADAYWATRPRTSQLGAWASEQSQPLSSRAVLVARFAGFSAQYAGRPIPRPPHWSGLRVVPDRIEIWRARPFRLHERILYQRRGRRWVKSLLYP